ncbi:MAG: amino acid ABC transporter substrate-binding protein [Rhodoplanes sp.]|uniref:amino acid ABC transporter substrate-binding protein n=1 Tax=Rhodoplanes sp. TaxID=1968906 RepID=UPI00184BCE40|nr:amino acid ABC transporter substrate-binding protein [Rhodoplanes sp.]NVO13380.1 amino acid ABC transporter substrate-binding protein [Rhodoplanes sp.]
MRRLVALCAVLLAAATSANAQGSIPSGSRLQSIIDKKTVRIAYRADASPFSFVDDKKEPAGYTIDLCRIVATSLGQQYGTAGIKIDWVPVTVQTRFAAIMDGKADLECGATTVTLGRMRDVDFSSIVFVESTGVVVSRATNIRTFSDLAGRKIAVVAGTSNERAAIEQIRMRKLQTTLVAVKDRDEGFAALEAGKVDAYVSDKLLLVGAQMKRPDALVMLPDDLSVEPYAIVLPRGDWALRLAVNTGLAQFFRGNQNGELFRRWFEPVGMRPGLLIGAAYTLGALAD